MQAAGCKKIIFSSSATVYKPVKTVDELPFIEGSQPITFNELSVEF